jgi:hypothetical protein
MAEEIKAPVNQDTETKDKKIENAPLQDPIKQELEKAKIKKEFSEQEKTTYNLRKIAEKAKELGIDPKTILSDEEEQPKDEIPEWYKREEAKKAQKTSLQLADSISDADERALTKEYLSSRIVPSGDPEVDFRFALSAVRSLKNTQILEDITRGSSVKTTAAGGSAPIKVETQFVPTPAEEIMMKAPYNLSKEKIIEARRSSEAKQR